MAIVIIFIGTILLVGFLIGCLAWILNAEEKPQMIQKETVAAPRPALSNITIAKPEPVQERVAEKEPVAQPQSFVPQLIPFKAAESLRKV